MGGDDFDSIYHDVFFFITISNPKPRFDQVMLKNATRDVIDEWHPITFFVVSYTIMA